MIRRKPGEPNPEVLCACGCGSTFDKYDEAGRPRVFLSGHARRGTGRENPIVACACGCGATFPKYDTSNRPRRFLGYHRRRTR